MYYNICGGKNKMKFTEEQRKSINQYILLKIDEKCDGLSKYVSDAFKISTSTVHNYLKKLIEDGVIVKDGKDKYQILPQKSRPKNPYSETRLCLKLLICHLM